MPELKPRAKRSTHASPPRGLRSRGQALLLFCLTLLLLTLMVLITLGIATRVKDRIELQNVADAAAYSEAVVSARAFNAISLMNRTQVSHMVALAAVQSLISWSGYNKAAMEGAKQALIKMQLACPGPDVAAALSALHSEKARVDASWENMDHAAGAQQLRLQGIAASYKDYEHTIYNDWARSLIEGRGGRRTLSQKIADEAREGSPWRGNPRDLFADKAVMAAAGYPSNQEMNNAVSFGDSDHSLHITMGSRLDTFITMRGNGTANLNAMIGRLIGGNGFTANVTNLGSGYYSNQASGTTMTHGAKPLVGGTWGWGDDHGALTLTRSTTCPGQTETAALTAWLYSSDIQNNDDMHGWSPGWDNDVAPPFERHTYGGCKPCPGIWPGRIEYNEGAVANRANIFGQPKNIVVMQRDLAARDAFPDPWELNFTYKFNRATAGTEIDLRKRDVPPPAKVQAALATGLVYYHRGSGGTPDHWKEPPNFYNPFWRATLVATDVDETGPARGNSAIDALEQHGLADQAQTIRLLRANGFRGLQ